MTSRAQRLLVLGVLVVAAVSACRKKQPEVAPQPVNNAPPETCDQRCRDSIRTANERRIADSIAAAAAAAKAANDRAIAALRATLAEKVFFDYDQSV